MQTQLSGDRPSLHGWERMQSLGDQDKLQRMAAPEGSSLLCTLIATTWESPGLFSREARNPGGYAQISDF